MKNTSLIINVILAVAVIALFVIVLSDRKGSQQGSDNVNGSAAAEMGIVFVNTDSLIIKYDLARELSEELIRKEESSRTDFNERVRVFEQDMMEFQRKLQNNGFLSLDRAQSEERRLRQKEQELQALNTRLTNDLMEAQNTMNQQLRDTITNFLKDYCKEKSYSMVLSNTMGDNLLYADSVFDVTDDVVAKLNERYAAAKK
ncbi:OmpH family outer membrane protein [Xiashengella succiniciproducens]|jgi:outer membrane protein|uniref:OmpH family outer membrane protein n=1 Tax=Xiashengella succiniciproducens TaxID=2949635 RepID=A0A9J6ZQE5_9BACT|nr:OmpH family outer membrane protein [Alkaliflexus sp. Ai-910]URW79488.1 OmpH family outer membrane protein [Alkaliflexus sp. Ai-910]